MVNSYNNAVKRIEDYEAETKTIRANHVSYEALYNEKIQAKNAASCAVKRSEEKIKEQQKKKEDAEKEKNDAIKAYDDCVSTTQYDASTEKAIFDYYKTRSGLASESVETAKKNKETTAKTVKEKTAAANVVVTNAKTNVETKKTNYETSKNEKDSFFEKAYEKIIKIKDDAMTTIHKSSSGSSHGGSSGRINKFKKCY